MNTIKELIRIENKIENIDNSNGSSISKHQELKFLKDQMNKIKKELFEEFVEDLEFDAFYFDEEISEEDFDYNFQEWIKERKADAINQAA